ncbi:energy-coupling factor ABC transporter ATP-binding protein [Halalkalibacterium ligniniphilum]|uniref:energy-coupling factor ABC transporter ATP-binding protein n=1 Tax=Halalkalibacterium ligniniphilum TaxID=1134413 RepID=UPI0003468A2F|nr:energy-coupling factor ABC transporter ATP-binding protein [Halalkalibacterium ligniniphilum]
MDIEVKQLEHRYMQGTPFEKIALSDVTLSIPSGSYTAIIGHTGSGKSTLVQHFNGLIKPSHGQIKIGQHTIEAGKKPKELRELRRKVGLVFQYPEHQLFEETVAKDICFGPINFGLSEQKALKRAKEILPLVGLSEDLLEVSPFDLSGGQMRRVAIAGVLAIQPSVLILDEPTAGLDPAGQRAIMKMFYELHQEKGMTTVLVTHNMADAAAYADHIIVMNEGKVAAQGDRLTVFTHVEMLQELGLDVPNTLRFLQAVKQRFQLEHVPALFTVDELADYMKMLLEEGGAR